MSRKFCHRLLKDSAPVTRYIHVLFVEFADQLLKAKNCYDTEGSNNEMNVSYSFL